MNRDKPVGTNQKEPAPDLGEDNNRGWFSRSTKQKAGQPTPDVSSGKPKKRKDDGPAPDISDANRSINFTKNKRPAPDTEKGRERKSKKTEGPAPDFGDSSEPVEPVNTNKEISPETFSKYLRILSLLLVLGLSSDERVKNLEKTIQISKTNPTENNESQLSEHESLKLIEEIERIDYSKHEIFSNLNRELFCIFYNEFLKGKEVNLQKLWKFLIDSKNKGKISEESLANYKKIIQEVIKIQKDFSKKGFFTKEGIASNFIPNTEKAITDAVTKFLSGNKKTQDINSGFEKTFEVLSRNKGLIDEIEGLLKDMVEAMKSQVVHTLKNGTEKEKIEAHELAKVLIDTLKYFEKSK